MKKQKQPLCKGSGKPGNPHMGKNKCPVCGFPFPRAGYSFGENIPKHHAGKPT